MISVEVTIMVMKAAVIWNKTTLRMWHPLGDMIQDARMLSAAMVGRGDLVAIVGVLSQAQAAVVTFVRR